MSGDRFAEAAKLWPHDDIDAINFAAWCSVCDWLRTVEPFQRVRFTHVSLSMERLGQDLTRHVDADARTARAAKRMPSRGIPSLESMIEAMMRDIDEARARADAEADARPDDLASGW